MAFEPGEVVMLKSGGHSMTVASVSDDEVVCLWIGESGQLFRETLPAVTLESVFSVLGENDKDDDEEPEVDEDDDEEDEDEAVEDDDEEASRRKKRAR